MRKQLSASRDSVEGVKVRCFIAEQAHDTLQQLRRPKGRQGVSQQVTQSVFAMFSCSRYTTAQSLLCTMNSATHQASTQIWPPTHVFLIHWSSCAYLVKSVASQEYSCEKSCIVIAECTAFEWVEAAVKRLPALLLVIHANVQAGVQSHMHTALCNGCLTTNEPWLVLWHASKTCDLTNVLFLLPQNLRCPLHRARYCC